MMKMWKPAALAAIVISFIVGVPVQAKENMVPNYEVKFMLDSSQVVSDSGKLKKSYRTEFQTGNDYKTIGARESRKCDEFVGGFGNSPDGRHIENEKDTGYLSSGK